MNICFVISLALICLQLNANEITIRQIPFAKELPTNTVTRIFQDNDGFVWLGSPYGFCRYDGYNMKSFRSEVSNPVFPSNNITGGFAEDSLNNTLWIGTEKGVLILDKHSHTIVSLDIALLGESTVRQILYADNGMWVCSDDGLYLYGLDRLLIKRYLESANSIHIDNRGTVRVTSWNNGIYYLDKAIDTFLPYPRIGSQNRPHKIFQDNAGAFWICTWGNGLYRFYPDRQGTNMYEYVDAMNNNNFDFGIFYGIEQDDVNGYFWVLSFAGVSVFRVNNERIVPVDKLVAPINDLTNFFSDIIKDRNGSLWLGSFEQGVIIVNPTPSFVTNFDLQFIKAQTGYVPNIVKIFEDKNDELWIRQDRIGIFLLHPETKAIRRLDIPEISDANAICNRSETDEIWVASEYTPNIRHLSKTNGIVRLTGTSDLRDILGENAQAVKFLL